MLHCLGAAGFVVEVTFGVVVVEVAAVAGEEGFDDDDDDDLSIGVFDGSGEWTAKIGWMTLVEEVAAVVVGRDFNDGGRD